MFLRQTALAGGIALGLRPVAADAQSDTWVILPRLTEIQEYSGLLLYVGSADEAERIPEPNEPGETPNDEPADVPVGQCEFDDAWPAERTTRVDAVLLDRTDDESDAYEARVYLDEEQTVVEEGQYYITHETVECSDDYVATPVASISEEEVPEFQPEHADDPDIQEPGTAEGGAAPADDSTPGEGAGPANGNDETPLGPLAAFAALVVGAGYFAIRRMRGEN